MPQGVNNVALVGQKQSINLCFYPFLLKVLSILFHLYRLFESELYINIACRHNQKYLCTGMIFIVKALEWSL